MALKGNGFVMPFPRFVGKQRHHTKVCGESWSHGKVARMALAGWTVGGGIEWLFLPNWSVKWEYLYIDLGKLNYADRCISAICGQSASAPAYATSVQFREQVARVGINYHFNPPPAAVVAKY